ncbi:MAG: hypothetical protein K9M13_00585, partial [Simkaniaceae bacterium]|nr:hypothetical protein [Simkaniaceae bacterium]
WERQYNGDLWTARQSWFLKPFVLQLTPFQKSLYLDLDCEVKMPLNSLFNMDTPFAVALETTRTDLFNSGVILYEKNSPILHAWKEEVQTKNHLHMGDQDILSALIETQQFKWDLLDKTYNMRPAFTADLDHAAIVHRVGLVGKRDIMAQMIERITH